MKAKLGWHHKSNKPSQNWSQWFWHKALSKLTKKLICFYSNFSHKYSPTYPQTKSSWRLTWVTRLFNTVFTTCLLGLAPQRQLCDAICKFKTHSVKKSDQNHLNSFLALLMYSKLVVSGIDNVTLSHLKNYPQRSFTFIWADCKKKTIVLYKTSFKLMI